MWTINFEEKYYITPGDDWGYGKKLNSETRHGYMMAEGIFVARRLAAS